MRQYILTDPTGRTRNEVEITPGRYVHRDGTRADLYSRIRADCHSTPLLAVLLSPFDSEAAAPKLFRVDHWGVAMDADDPRGYTVIKEHEERPKVTLEQRLAFAVLVVSRLLGHGGFEQWARAWVNGEDRSAEAAVRTRKALEEEARAASGLAALGGLGELTVGDREAMERLRRFGEHAHRVLRAVELAAQPVPDRGAMLAEIAEALVGVSEHVPEADLQVIAETVVRA